MKRWARTGACFLPAAVLATVTALPAEANAPAGVVVGGVTSPRAHQARLCFPGTRPTCPAGGC